MIKWRSLLDEKANKEREGKKGGKEDNGRGVERFHAGLQRTRCT